nr:hypothetical protein [Tanacetum cinerariifolium]
MTRRLTTNQPPLTGGPVVVNSGQAVVSDGIVQLAAGKWEGDTWHMAAVRGFSTRCRGSGNRPRFRKGSVRGDHSRGF